MSITCIIVNYNNAKYLEQAVNSVLNQTYPVDQIIIADDASADNSREIIQSLKESNSCVKAILRNSNIGVSANRDLAIRDVSTEYFTTLDSDDIFYPEKIEKEYCIADWRLDTIAYSNVNIIDEHNHNLGTINTSMFGKLSVQERLQFLVARRKGMPRDMLMSKKLYLACGGFQHSLSRYEDWDLKIRLVDSNAEWIHSGIVGIGYRRIGEGLSSVNQLIHTIDKLKVLIIEFWKIRHKKAFVYGLNELLFYKGVRKAIQAIKGNGNEIL